MTRLKLYVYDPKTEASGLTSDQAQQAARLSDALARAHARYQMQKERLAQEQTDLVSDPDNRELSQAVQHGRDTLDSLEQIGVSLNAEILPAAFWK